MSHGGVFQAGGDPPFACPAKSPVCGRFDNGLAGVNDALVGKRFACCLRFPRLVCDGVGPRLPETVVVGHNAKRLDVFTTAMSVPTRRSHPTTLSRRVRSSEEALSDGSMIFPGYQF